MNETRGRTRLDERFETGTLDTDLWVPSYLAHWSSKAAAAATWRIEPEGLVLSIPPEQPLWCPDLHEEPLRVSGIQSASFSGPLGSASGPQPFRDGLVVREEQPTQWGYTPHRGRIEIEMRGRVDDASMFACWLAGIEDRPERSGELCLGEIFGSTIRDGAIDVGVGIHRFRDPSLTEAFVTIRRRMDPSDFHAYRLDWSAQSVELFVDDEPIHRVSQSPDYPMQLMIGVFDFPARRGSSAAFTPEMTVARIRGGPLEVD